MESHNSHSSADGFGEVPVLLFRLFPQWEYSFPIIERRVNHNSNPWNHTIHTLVRMGLEKFPYCYLGYSHNVPIQNPMNGNGNGLIPFFLISGNSEHRMGF